MEKGNAPGVREVPEAKLVEALRPYLGVDQPQWHPRWLAFRGVRLLVIEVPAAGPGSAIYCLNREYDKEPRAAIYVRHPGRTALATPDDLVRLTERARGRSLRGISVEVAAGTAHRLDLSAAAAQAWLAAERARLLAPLQAVPERPGQSSGAVARLRNQAERLSRRLDVDDPSVVAESRTVADYRREVTEYVGACAQVIDQACRSGARWLAPVSLRLVNTTIEFWQSLELTLSLPQDCWAQLAGGEHQDYPVAPHLLGLPRAPRPFGSARDGAPRPVPQACPPARTGPADQDAFGPSSPGPVSPVIEPDGRVRFPACDARPAATLDLDPVVLCTAGSGPLQLQWQVTGTVRGLLGGRLTIPVADRVWTPAGLIGAPRP
jgi:hypothetical protein